MTRIFSRYQTASDALAALCNVAFSPNVPSRVGLTKERQFAHFTIVRPLERELINPSRKANVAAQIAETMWVLSGRNDVEWLSHYLPRAGDFSDDGETWRAGYGPRLRYWNSRPEDGHVDVDQLAEVVRLLQEDPATRRAVISLWDPAVDYAESKDIPCNNWLHFLARGGVLSMHVGIRSNDLIWGWSGINQFEWSVLLELVATLTGLEVGQIHYAVTSLHVYEKHWEKANSIARESYQVRCGQRFALGDLNSVGDWDRLCSTWFKLEEDIRLGRNVGRLAVAHFPDPLLWSWLRVLQWWWTGNSNRLEPIRGTRLAKACEVGMQPPEREPEAVGPRLHYTSDFLNYAVNLHNEKHAAYGDSWKRRGEMLGIMANIARKVDRLGAGNTADETSADTAMDLMIYLAKYSVWLDNRDTDTTELTNNALLSLERHVFSLSEEYGTGEALEEELRVKFTELEEHVVKGRPAPDRLRVVVEMMVAAYVRARQLWEAERAPK